MNNIDNPLYDYQSPPKEALRDFGIDISKEVVEKYTLEKFSRLPRSHIEMTSARDSKIVEETRRLIGKEHGAFREIKPHKIGGRNGERIDCSTLEDEPVIVADNEADRQVLRDCFKE